MSPVTQASVLEGELDLSKCYNVSEYQVQRNYGFQIHVKKQTKKHHKTQEEEKWSLKELNIYIYKYILLNFIDPKWRLHVVSHDIWDS